MADDSNEKPIIKKVIKVEGGGHHGGAWKVAYADFVTAMMAFFMLLWLLNVAPPETLAGLADYFTPTTAAIEGRTGSDAVNAPSSDANGNNPTPVAIIQQIGPPPGGPNTGEETGTDQEGGGDPDFAADVINNRVKEAEDLAFEQLQDQMRIAMQASPTLSDLSEQVLFEITEDGLKIQLIDKDRRAMFRSGTAELYGYAETLIREVGASVQTLPNRITIQGHTDGGQFRGANGYSNWDLSADRGNSALKVLSETGVTDDRFFEVTGKASTDPLYPDNPSRIENRRVTILVLREAPVVPPSISGRR
ncbi:flagellar motor protein MotB [Kordiimonas sp. SCSIO 12610]|uniref:flagellar motor protein MotB n=1 Tax=Kordiimonas sp. SCSIO 12610 TaxID=2829597 RepID=UPI002109B49F|nr:flagellar motor protein MotB [Kordiimonas sp. SCSIO 12610]UTW56681.1 OmpA family protein [Kordiimonas sp. SCSIO 12610]